VALGFLRLTKVDDQIEPLLEFGLEGMRFDDPTLSVISSTRIRPVNGVNGVSEYEKPREGTITMLKQAQ
jgi:hypothetical protein